MKITGTSLSGEQEAAVRSDRAAIVSAGAGSGKTTVLALRFLRLVLDGKAHSDEILTLTFTKKAAAEMYDRIHRYLAEASCDDLAVEMELKEHFPKAQISTMDSFWAEIARTDSLRYGVTRDFSILSPDELDEMLSRIADELEGEDGWLELSELYKRDEILDRLSLLASKTTILTRFSAEENLEAHDELQRLYDEAYQKEMEDALFSLQFLVNDPKNMKQDSKSVKTLQADLDSNAKAFANGDYSLMTRFRINRSFSEPVKTLITERYRKALENLQGLSGDNDQHDYLSAVSSLIASFLARLNREKRVMGRLTFQDAEALAFQILLDNKSVRDWYKKRFKYIMVDEFQDNNASQRDLLFLLSERRDVFSNDVPRPEDLDPVKLFFVGDEKQSIYSFRGADVSVFRSLKDDVARMNGEILSLSKNFRSEPGLINHFNNVFSAVFDSEETHNDRLEETLLSGFTGIKSASYEAEYEEIKARDAKDVFPSIKLAVFEKDKDDGAAPGELNGAESEAVYIADKIISMVRGDDYLLPGKRRPRFRDIAVLVRTTASQIPVEKYFRLKNIPYVVLESSAVTMEGPASDIYSFLQLLLFPEDRLSYLSLLRSPFCRLSDKALLFYADRDEEGFEAFNEDPEMESEEDRVSYDILKSLYLECRDLVGRAPLTEVVSRLWHESGYQAWMSSRRDLWDFEEHYRYIWTLAEKADRDGKGLSALLDYLRPMIGHAERLRDISLQHYSSDSVQIMTIHKSKGLQFPIVILPSLDRGLSNRGEPVVALKGKRPYLMITSKDKDPLEELMNRYAGRRERAERKRILYVAATRAETHLLVTACKSQGQGMLKDYQKCGLAADEIIFPGIDPVRHWEDRIQDYSFYDRPVYERGRSVMRRIGVRDYAEADNSMLSGPLLPPLSVDGIVKERGIYTDFGVIVHEALEAKLKGTVPCFTKAEGVDEETGKALEEAALSIADGFVSSLFYSRYVGGRRVETEVRFYYPENGQVLEGVADLLVFGDDVVTIIDYKTDRRKNPEQHRGQLENYAKALSDIYKKPCKAVLCYVRDFSDAVLI